MSEGRVQYAVFVKQDDNIWSLGVTLPSAIAAVERRAMLRAAGREVMVCEVIQPNGLYQLAGRELEEMRRSEGL